MRKLKLLQIVSTLRKAKVLKDFHEGSCQQAERICLDSRKAKSSDLFIAIKGQEFDGHLFVNEAIKNGARFIILEDSKIFYYLSTKENSNSSLFLVRSSRKAWAYLESKSWGKPQDTLRLHAVTGTNGKSSVAWISSKLSELSGFKSLYIGTLGAFFAKRTIKTDHTTPDPNLLYKFLDTCTKKNVKDVFIEVSSHALVQGKVSGLEFTTAVFTSFSHDHLDFHKNTEKYWKAKESLFSYHTTKNSRIIVHESLIGKLKPQLKSEDIYVFSELEKKQNSFKNLVISENLGSWSTTISFSFRGKNFKGEIPFFGSHNICNFLSSLLVVEKITGQITPPKYWLDIKQIPGRMERVFTLQQHNRNLPLVFIDYAHTPEALELALKSLRKEKGRKIWTVFGCGGNRDKHKRPLMAAVAQAHSDKIIVTSDNPRSEIQSNILSDISSGFSDGYTAHIELNREKAISFAIKNAESEDIILIAGKGHETEQIIGSKKIPFSDKDIAKNYLESLLI